MNIDKIGGIVAIAAPIAAAAFVIGSLQSRVTSLESDNFFSQRREEFRAGLREDAVDNPGQGVPVGTVLAFYGTKPPEGFLLCQGQQVSTNDYPNLAIQLDRSGLLERVEGSSDQFNIPDLQGMFLRGLDSANDKDNDGEPRALGSTQDDSFQMHHHEVHAPEAANGRETFLEAQVAKKYPDFGQHTAAVVVHHTSQGNDEVYRAGKLIQLGARKLRTGEETRPVNVAVNWIIKY